MSINEYWLERIAQANAERAELLAALEDVIAMARSLGEVQSEYIDRTVSDFIEGDIEALIARVKRMKGGAA